MSDGSLPNSNIAESVPAADATAPRTGKFPEVVVEVGLTGTKPFIRPMIERGEKPDISPIQLAVCLARAAREISCFASRVPAAKYGGYLNWANVLDMKFVYTKSCQVMRPGPKSKEGRWAPKQRRIRVAVIEGWRLVARIAFSPDGQVTAENVLELLKIAGSPAIGLGMPNMYGAKANGTFEVATFFPVSGEWPDPTRRYRGKDFEPRQRVVG